jgi:sodium-dependent dicarboxylate transporter 2/3/5
MAVEDLLLSDTDRSLKQRTASIGLVVAPLVGLAVWLLHPDNMQHNAAVLLAILPAVLVLWVTEALPVAVTALLGPSVAVMLGVAPAGKLFAPFGDPMIFLFLGAFLLAQAAERTRLDRLLAARLFPDEKTSPKKTLLQMTFVSAAISSMFSNTATTAMMVPVARAAVRNLGPRVQAVGILSTAFAASIGGVLTPIGTPPNLLAMAALAKHAGTTVPFFHWSIIALPMAASCLVLWVIILLAAISRETAMHKMVAAPEVQEPRRPTDALSLQLGDGPWGLNRGQLLTLLVILLAAAGWIGPGIVQLVAGTESAAALWCKQRLPEGVVALSCASLLFVLPAAARTVQGKRLQRPILTWDEAAQIDWQTVLLYGGGMALGNQVFETGLSAWLGSAVIRVTGVETLVGLTFLFSTASLVLSELTNNTATAMMICPLAVMTAQQLGLSPVPPTIAAGLAASMGFLMPISTPCNAIAYGTGKIPLGLMMRLGAGLDLLGLVVIPTSVLILTDVLGVR